MTETPVSEMDFKLRLDLAGEAFDLREVARLVAELKAGKGTLAEFCDVLCLPMQPAAPAWNHDMSAAPRDGTRVLLAWPHWWSRPVFGEWNALWGCWKMIGALTSRLIESGPQPVAWMPLPPLPEVTR